MPEISLLADSLLIVLLGVALISIYRLNRRMAALREGRVAFETLTADLARQTDAATKSLAALRTYAETLGKQLDVGSDRGRQVIAEVQRASDDIRMLIGRADGASDKLEGMIAQARGYEALIGAVGSKMADRAGRPAPAQPESRSNGPAGDRPAEAGRADDPDERISPESAAFLSSLSGMR
jgi:hypothetical protein